jgi:hypothetical protein
MNDSVKLDDQGTINSAFGETRGFGDTRDLSSPIFRRGTSKNLDSLRMSREQQSIMHRNSISQAKETQETDLNHTMVNTIEPIKEDTLEESLILNTDLVVSHALL